MDRARQIVSNRWLVLAARLLLGGIFLASAIGKLQHPQLFVNTVVDYGMLPEGLSRFYGTVLPWAELAVGFSLILGLLSAAAAVVSVGMTVSFAIAGIYSLINAEDVPTICGCFGNLVSLSHSQSLALDAGMLLLAAVIALAGRKADEPGALRPMRSMLLGRPAWLAPAISLVGVVVLTGAIGLAIMATNEGPAEVPVTEKPRLMYFWNGCPECYGEEVRAVKSLQPDYGERADFVSVDYVVDPSSLSEYGVTDKDFTVLLLTWQPQTAEYDEQARFVGNLSVGTFDLAVIRDGLERTLDAGGQQA